MVKRDGESSSQRASEEESRADLREHYDIAARARAEPRAADAQRHEQLGRGARARLGGRSGAGDRRAPRPALYEAIDERGGLGGVVLTHDHQDHSEGTRRCASATRADGGERAAAGAGRSPAGRGAVDVALAEGARIGPFTAVATPGHAADHFALVAEGACFTGDAVLGTGSVFISPYPGAMAGYLLALARCGCARTSTCSAPGTGRPCGTRRAARTVRGAPHRP